MIITILFWKEPLFSFASKTNWVFGLCYIYERITSRQGTHRKGKFVAKNQDLNMLHSARIVLSGHTTISAFSFRPSSPSITTASSLGFCMEQSPPLKLKQRHQPHLACQATSRDDDASLRLNFAF